MQAKVTVGICCENCSVIFGVCVLYETPHRNLVFQSISVENGLHICVTAINTGRCDNINASRTAQVIPISVSLFVNRGRFLEFDRNWSIVNSAGNFDDILAIVERETGVNPSCRQTDTSHLHVEENLRGQETFLLVDVIDPQLELKSVSSNPISQHRPDSEGKTVYSILLRM